MVKNIKVPTDMKKENIVFWLSIIAIAISIVAIVFARNNINGPGFIIGVLSILTTVLIGWQIFVLFDLRETKNKIHKELKKCTQKTNMNNENSLVQAHLMIHLLFQKDSPRTLTMLFNGICLLYHISRVGDYEGAGNITKSILIFGDDIRALKIHQIDKNQMLLLLTKVENPNQISRYYDLLALVSSISLLK